MRSSFSILWNCSQPSLCAQSQIHWLSSEQPKIKYICFNMRNQHQLPTFEQTPFSSNQLSIPPYDEQSTIKLEYLGKTTYEKMLDDMNELEMKKKVREVEKQLLNEDVFVFLADMQPENMQWQVWKHTNQINIFLKQEQIGRQIRALQKYVKRYGQEVMQINKQYDQLKSIRYWNDQNIQLLLEFVNKLDSNSFLRKSVIYLTFVQHCLPLHLWKLKVFQQIPVYHDRGYLKKFIYKQQDIQKYLTVVGDGIIISSKNPMDTKVDQMIPFTNQIQCTCNFEEDDDIYFQISSFTHENIKVNLKKNYIGGLNFYIGTKRALKSAGYFDSKSNRFESFSTVRYNCSTKLYNDGCDYLSDLCDELIKAKQHVCITDWWMSPYILLKRQFNNVSVKKNKKYRLDEVLTFIANRGVKVYIILFREPLGLVCNDSEDCQLYLETRSPNIRIRRHPIVPQLWSHHEKCVIIDQKVAFMGGIDLCYGRWDTPDHFISNVGNLWDGGDYVNDRLRTFPPGQAIKDENYSPLQRDSEPRMPWHDIALMLRGDAVIDLARHFVQYWYFVDAERVKDPYNHLRNVQRRYDRVMRFKYPDWDQKFGTNPEGCCNKVALCGTRTKLFFTGTQNKLRELLVQTRPGQYTGDQSLQLCRSASTWSIGARQYEQSIHNAYQGLIEQSEHLIYIENQFFMGEKNQIVECLAKRIRLAHQRKENFKIVVVMPLLPGFEGDITKRANGPLRYQVNNQFLSINRGQNSLYHKLKDLKDFRINDYIFFFGLRAHGMIDSKPQTEIVYVHSKLMIVDDKRAIIGSANINDRSLCGNRDSELAIVIEQDNGQILDGVPRRKGIFDLRVRLFSQHFGLTKQETAVSNNPQIWAKMINNAKRNTLIYRQLFGCYPDDTITTSSQAKQRQVKNPNLQLYLQKKNDIFAHAVEFPLRFMEDENLKYQFGDNKQGLLDQEAFL